MRKKIVEEVRSIAITAIYFGVVFVILISWKTLILRDYHIQFAGIAKALIGALVLAKVVLLMKLIPLGNWIKQKPPIVDVLLRTVLYSLGTLVIIILEKSFEMRHEANGFGNAMSFIINHRDMNNIWAITIGVSGSLLVYNLLSILGLKLGAHGLRNLFFFTPLKSVTAKKIK